jgi:hypothetical protein
MPTNLAAHKEVTSQYFLFEIMAVSAVWFTFLNTHTHTNMYIYIYVCVCVCVCVFRDLGFSFAIVRNTFWQFSVFKISSDLKAQYLEQ